MLTGATLDAAESRTVHPPYGAAIEPGDLATALSTRLSKHATQAEIDSYAAKVEQVVTIGSLDPAGAPNDSTSPETDALDVSVPPVARDL